MSPSPESSSIATPEGPAGASDAVSETRVRLVAIAAIGVALTLAVAKLVAWLMTGSVALLSSFADSVLDALASGVNLFAIRASQAPPDREHRFGHGKAEPLAGLAQSAFVAGAAVVVAVSGIDSLVQGSVVQASAVGIGVMVFSLVLTIALVLYQRRVLRDTHSTAVEADSLHYTGDILMNLAVIAAIATAGYGWQWVDGVAGIGIAVFLLVNAGSIARSSLAILMDAELPDADRNAILEIALGDPEVRGVHDLRTRSSGPHRFVQMHLELPGTMVLSRAHAVGDRVMLRIQEAFPNTDVLVHIDPLSDAAPTDPFPMS